MGSRERFEAFDVAVTRRGPFRPAPLLEHATELRADARGIFVDGESLVAYESIRAAYAHPSDDGRTAVVVDAGATTIELRLETTEQAASLLAAIGFGALQRAARFGGISVEDESESVIGRFGALAILTAGAAAGVSALLGNGLLVLPLVVGVFVLAVVHATRSVGLTVGADGLAYERFGLPPRFVPYAQVASLDAESESAVLTLDSGERIALRFGANDGAAVEGSALVARMRELLDLHARRRSALPERDSIRDLGAVATEREASYRAPVIPDGVLWAILEDPTARSESRIEAAAALRASLDDDGRVRLRFAADACASPKLRVALDAIADDEDAAASPRARRLAARRPSPP